MSAIHFWIVSEGSYFERTEDPHRQKPHTPCCSAKDRQCRAVLVLLPAAMTWNTRVGYHHQDKKKLLVLVKLTQNNLRILKETEVIV